MTCTGSASINTSRQDERLGLLATSHAVRVEGSTFKATLDSLGKAVLVKIDSLPDDEAFAWTDVSISILRKT